LNIITYKYKLYNNKKNTILHKHINIACDIYNHCILLHKKYYRLYGKYLNIYKLQKHITKLRRNSKKYNYWLILGSDPFQELTERIDKSYKQFFRKKKHGKKASIPSFRKYFKYNSITFKKAGYKFLENNKLLINKKLYKYSKSYDITGKIKTLTVKRNSLGEFFICAACEINNKPIKRTLTGKRVGFDFGLKTFLTSSDNIQYNSPLFYYIYQDKLAYIDKKISKCIKGSNNKKRLYKQRNRLYNDMTNRRFDYHVKLAKKFAIEYDYICIENLDIESIKEKYNYGKKTSDLAYSQFIQLLEYQCYKHGTILTKIDRYYPSSKTCSNCGNIKDIQLTDREYKCNNCGIIIDRDYNASLNILKKGIETVRTLTVY
jgi:putative transposase